MNTVAGVSPRCLNCGVEIDFDVFPSYCMDCFHMLRTTGKLPNGLRRQQRLNGDD